MANIIAGQTICSQATKASVDPKLVQEQVRRARPARVLISPGPHVVSAYADSY